MHDPRETRRDNAFSSRLQIVNWNRNPILIKEIRLLTPSEITLSSVRVEDHDAGRRNVPQQEYIRGRMFVPGWVDRSKIPIVAEFDLTFSTNNPSLTAFAENNLVRLSVKLRIDITIAPSGIVLKASSWSDRMLGGRGLGKSANRLPTLGTGGMICPRNIRPPRLSIGRQEPEFCAQPIVLLLASGHRPVR